MPQIIRQPEQGPEDHFAIWSSTVDNFTHLSMTEEEVVRHFASLAYEEARAKTVKIIEQLRKGDKPYRGATLSWGEANEKAYKARRGL